MYQNFTKLIERKEPFEDILGQTSTKKQLLSALVSNRNVIIVGPPGIGKTTLAKNVSKYLPELELNDCDFNCDPKNPICPRCRKQKSKTTKVKGEKRFIRIQGSPDLTVEDLLGDIDPIKALEYGPLSLEAFTPGKIFKANNGVLFFDEVNRCPEKLQNALLEILEEKKATIGSYDIDFPANFIFLGSMNPEDFSGTEKLSEVFLDRFDIVYMDYPESLEIERQIVKTKSKNLSEVTFPEDLLDLTLEFVRGLRHHKDIERAPSVRVSLGLYERSKANALIAKKTKVTLKDIEEAIISVVSHRIRLKPSAKYLISTVDFVKKNLKEYLESKEQRADFL